MTETQFEVTLADLLTMSDAPDWRAASCRGDANPEAWFPFPTEDFAYARSVCESCRIRVECAEFGIRTAQSGVWGGACLDRGRPRVA